MPRCTPRRRTAAAATVLAAALLLPTAAASAPAAGLPVAAWTAPVTTAPLPERAVRAPAGTAPTPRPVVPRDAPRAPAAEDTSDYVDTCHDATGAAVDLRRLGVAAVDDDTVELTVRACTDGALRGLGRRTLRWTFVDGRATSGATERRVEVTDADGDGTLEVVVRAVGPGGTTSPVATATSAGVRGPGTSTPVDELWVRVDVDALTPARACDPRGTSACTQLSVASFPAVGGDPADTMPNREGDTPTPVWPSRCTPALAPTGAGEHVVATTGPGAAPTVAARLRGAGYRATALPGLDAVEVPVGAGPEVVEALRGWREVTAVRPAPVRTPAAVVPDDPRYPDQWALPRLRVPDAWETTVGSPDTTIAVVDDGVDGTRTDLAGRVIAGYDAVADRSLPAGADSDLGAHGTAVAGLAAATGDDAAGLAGVDWRARVLPVRVADHEGCIDVAPYLRALDWLGTRAEVGGVDVVNVSLGGRAIDGEPARITALHDAGVVVVAAMGNEGDTTGSRPSYPARLPEVVAVTATGPDDEVAGYANRGRYVDVAAPGGDQSGAVARDVLALADPTRDGAVLTPLAGTSFSSPMVAGVASLYLAAHSGATPADVTRALLDGTRDLGAGLAGVDPAFGFGMVDAAAVVRQAPGRTTVRLQGEDRYATAAAASRRAFRDPALVDVVLLATGRDHPDALAGGPLAAREHAPVLLTGPDALHPATAAELDRLDPSRVLLLGGAAALSPAVADELAADGRTVTRIAGVDRYETAARLAVGVLADGDPAPAWDAWARSDVVLLATGTSFPDALAGGAAAAAVDAPLLLTAGDRLTEVTAAVLDRLDPSLVVVLGGARAVSDEVVAEVAARPGGPEVVRAAGTDRYATAVAAACPDPRVCTTDTRYAVVATGATFADALAGSATAAALRAPLLLVPPRGSLPPAVADGLRRLAPEQAVVLGGTAAVADEVVDEVAGTVVR